MRWHGRTSAKGTDVKHFCMLLAALFFFDVTWAQKCARHAQHLACGSFSGLLFSVNNQWPPRRVTNLTHFKPFDVPHNVTLSISLCNFCNLRVHDITIRNVTLVPSLVGSIGKNAIVRVHMYNTSNLDVSGRLVIGYPRPEVASARNYGGNGTHLVSNLIRGPISDGASVVVDVSKSANVRLRPGTRDLWLSKATLLNELINGAHTFHMHCVIGVCYEARVWDSANIHADEPKEADSHKPDVIIQSGQLEDESIDTGCIGPGSFVRVVKRNIANIHGIRNLHIWEGELSDEAVDVLNIQNSRVEVSVKDCANVDAEHVSIIESELIDEMVDSRDITDSEVSVTCINSANIRAQSIDIVEGELIDESVDARDVLRSSVIITMLHSGNVRAHDSASIIEGELVDEILDAVVVHNGEVDISLQNTSNVLCGAGAVSLEKSELLENIIDAADFREIKASMFIADSANLHVPADWVHMSESRLAAKPVDIDLVRGGIKFTALRSMGNACARCMGHQLTCASKGYYRNHSLADSLSPKYK